MKPFLKNTTLACADTTNKVEWSARAIKKSLEQCDFAAVKLFTNRTDLKYAVEIPDIKGLGGYSNFCVRDMAKYINTPFALVVQYDGFVLNGAAWTDEFEQWDFIGAPTSGAMQNGGFSLRSKRLLDFIARANWRESHPEDYRICIEHRSEIEAAGMRFAPVDVARRFSMEGRSWTGVEWSSTLNSWNGEFGWHSLLTRLPPDKKPCKVAVHAGDAGDTIYACAALRALGGGMLFLTPKNKYPYPLDSRWTRDGGSAAFVDNLAPLLEEQPYIVGCRYTHGNVHSCDFDLNRFRLPWKERSARDNDSILKLHCDAFGVKWDETQPWLTVDEVWPVPGRPICVNRSGRYHNDEAFGWYDFVQRYGSKIFFLGTEQEAHIFQGFGAPNLEIPWIPTNNLLEAARYIAGAKVFAGNQSSCLAIAHGLGKNTLCECWKGNPNCMLNRGNAIYYLHGSKPVEIPQEWLA